MKHSPEEELQGRNWGDCGSGHNATQRPRRPRSPPLASGRVRLPLCPWVGSRAPQDRNHVRPPNAASSPRGGISATLAPPASGMSPGHARAAHLPSACSSEFMSAGSSGHGRAPARIAAPRPPPGPQRQLPPLTAPPRPSPSHRPLTKTRYGHRAPLSDLTTKAVFYWLTPAVASGPSVGRSAGGAKNCRRPG